MTVGTTNNQMKPYRLDTWEVRPEQKKLVCQRTAKVVRLEGRAMQVLQALVAAHGQFLSRDQLFERVWGDRPVTDDSLTGAVKTLRKALGDDPKQPKFIETRKNVGYRLIVAPGSVVRSTHWLAFAAAAMLAVALLLGSVNSEQSRDTQPTVLAVLPFSDLSSESPSHLAPVITDALIMRFGEQPGLSVIARSSAQAFQDASDLQAAAQQLGADLLVTGTVLQSGDQIRVNARIVDPSNLTQLWARQFDRPLADAIGLQDELGSAIAMQIGAAVKGEAATVAMTPDAMQRLLKSRYLLTTGQSVDLHQAVVDFTRLVEEYPQSARAHLGLAEAQLALFKRGETGVERLYLALESAMEAERIGGESAQLHRLIGQAQLFAHYDYSAAERRYQKALALNPSDTITHRRYAWLMVAQGRYVEAIRQWEHTRRLDPASFASADYAYLKLFAGRPAEALADFEALSAGTEFGSAALRAQFVAYHVLGDVESSDAVLRQLAVRTLEIDDATVGQLSRQQILRQMLDQRSYNSLVAGAGYAAILGSQQEAIALLEEAVNRRDPFAIFINAMPEFSHFREDPRFVKLLHAIGRAPTRYLAST